MSVIIRDPKFGGHIVEKDHDVRMGSEIIAFRSWLAFGLPKMRRQPRRAVATGPELLAECPRYAKSRIAKNSIVEPVPVHRKYG